MSEISKLGLADKFILPLFILLGTKYISIFIINLLFSFSWKFGFSFYQVFSLPLIHYSDKRELLAANSLSSLFMILVAAVGFTWIIFRYQHFHEHHVKPKTAANLHLRKMENLILNDSEFHRQLIVWFSLAWFVFIFILLEFLGGSVILPVLSLNLTIVLFLSLVIISDMYKRDYSKKG